MALQKAFIDAYGILDVPKRDENELEFKKRMLTSAFFVIKLTKVDAMPIKVSEQLYIGSVGAAYTKESLVSCNITHVICAASTPQLKFPSLVKYLKLELDDDISSPRCEINYLLNSILIECFTFFDALS